MWDLTGKQVVGKYLDRFEVSGVVKESRVAYGGRVRHSIYLDIPIKVFGAERDSVILNAEEVTEIL